MRIIPGNLDINKTLFRKVFHESRPNKSKLGKQTIKSHFF